jgi:hypothetical protein
MGNKEPVLQTQTMACKDKHQCVTVPYLPLRLLPLRLSSC